MPITFLRTAVLGTRSRIFAVFAVDPESPSAYVPRTSDGAFSRERESVAQPVEQLTFNQ